MRARKQIQSVSLGNHFPGSRHLAQVLVTIAALAFCGCAGLDYRLHPQHAPYLLLNQTMRAADDYADRGHWRPVSRPLLELGPFTLSTALRVRVDWRRLRAWDWSLPTTKSGEISSSRARAPGDLSFRFRPSSSGAYVELTWYF